MSASVGYGASIWRIAKPDFAQVRPTFTTTCSSDPSEHGYANAHAEFIGRAGFFSNGMLRWLSLKLCEANLWSRGTNGLVDARAILYESIAPEFRYTRNIEGISNDTNNQT